jgi:hypothetical protein
MIVIQWHDVHTGFHETEAEGTDTCSSLMSSKERVLHWRGEFRSSSAQILQALIPFMLLTHVNRCHHFHTSQYGLHVILYRVHTYLTVLEFYQRSLFHRVYGQKGYY